MGPPPDIHRPLIDDEAKIVRQGAMKAISQKHEASPASESIIVEHSTGGLDDDQEIENVDEHPNQFSVDNNALHAYEPMEHMLTEDGEPMLNPGRSHFFISLVLLMELVALAELLTQVGYCLTTHLHMTDCFTKESLASPPPS